MTTSFWFSERSPGARWLALDRLRAAAFLLMVQGHTFAALLRPDALSAEVNHAHEVLHGLTAPMFLLGAGLAFATTSYARCPRHRALNGDASKRFARYLKLLLIGYLLQLPGGDRLGLLRMHGEQLVLLCRIGPLQLIGFVLGLCQLAIFAMSTPRKHAALAAGFGVVTMLGSTPIARSGMAADLGVFIGSFLDDRGGSHFPIFPYATFVLFGVAWAGLLHRPGRTVSAPALTLLGLACSASAYAAFRAASAQQGAAFLWRTSPSFLLFRLGLVVLFLGLLHVRSGRSEGEPPREEWSAVLSRQALVGYVVHLFLLYGTPFSLSLAHRFGKALSVAQASAVCGLILAATIATMRAWDRLERGQLSLPSHKRMLGLGLMALALMAR